MAICGITMQAMYEVIINNHLWSSIPENPKDHNKDSWIYKTINSIFLSCMEDCNTPNEDIFNRVLENSGGKRAKMKHRDELIPLLNKAKDSIPKEYHLLVEKLYTAMSFQYYEEAEFNTRLVSNEKAAKQLTNSFFKSWAAFYEPVFQGFREGVKIKSEVYTRSVLLSESSGIKHSISGGIDFIIEYVKDGEKVFSLYDGKWNVSHFTDMEQLPFYASSLLATPNNGFEKVDELAFLDWRQGKMHNTSIPENYGAFLAKKLDLFAKKIDIYLAHLSNLPFKMQGDIKTSLASESFPYMKVGVSPSKKSCRFCNLGKVCNRSMQPEANSSFAQDNREALSLADGKHKPIQVEF